MTSKDNSDFLQELWYKYINSTYRNKSEALTAFLRSLYSKSLKQQNRLERLFYTNDTSGMITILIRQFLNDLEGLCFEQDDDNDVKELENADDEDEAPIDMMSGNAKNLKIYLESDRGALLLYGIDFVIEQYIQVKQNTNLENLRQNHLRIVQESELSNILATSLISLITYLTNKGLSGFSVTSYQEILHFSDLNLTDYLCNQLNRTSYVHYKRMRKRFSLLQDNPLNSDEEDEDDDEDDDEEFTSSDDEYIAENDDSIATNEGKEGYRTQHQLKSRRKKHLKPKPWPSSKPANNTKKSCPDISTTDQYGGYGGQTTIDTEENPDESSGQPSNQTGISDSANHHHQHHHSLPMYHISTSLRSAARILGKLSIIDKSRAIEEVSVYLEIVRQAINLLLMMTMYDKNDCKNPSLLLINSDTDHTNDANTGEHVDDEEDDLQKQNIINNLIRLVDDLLKNLVQSVTILLTSTSNSTSLTGGTRKDSNNLNSSINVLMGYKVIERIQSLSQSLNNATNSSLSLASLNIDLHKILIFILLTTTKQSISSQHLLHIPTSSTQSTQSLTGFIQLFSAWFRCDQSVNLLQQALNHESGDIEHGSSLLSKNRVSLFSLIRDLLSSIQNGCNKRKLDESNRISEANFVQSDNYQRMKISSLHHTASLNVIGLGNQPIKFKDKQCCYGILGQLLLNTLLHLLRKDSLPHPTNHDTAASAAIIKSKKYRLYPHILTHIRKLTFCCSIDLFQYSTELLTVLLNPNSSRVKSYLMRLLQTIIEISFGFYRNRDECECKYTSRHDTTLILKEIRRVCIPRMPKICSSEDEIKIQYSTTPIDLLHFVDWLARSHDLRMKKLVTEHIVYPILNRLKQISANKNRSDSDTKNSNEHDVTNDSKNSNDEFYDNNFIGYYENCLILIGSSVLTLLPYLNCQWTNEELELISNVCRTYTNLQPIYYKCLTTVVLSINTADYYNQIRDSSIDNLKDHSSTTISSPRSIKTRIIRHLLASINFNELMQVMDANNLPTQTNLKLIEILLHDVHVWNCFRQLFAYSLQFRTEILSNKNCPYTDCAYVMLKQVLTYICVDWEKNQSDCKEDESVANQKLNDCLSLLESLLSFVVDGNIVKSQRVYEGLSCDLLWANIRRFVLSNFPTGLEMSRKLMQAFLACCFRQKWTVHDGLYQLRRKFLDSVNSVKVCLQNTPNYNTTDMDDKHDLGAMATQMTSASDNESDNDDDDDDDDDESRNSEDASENDDNNDDDDDDDDDNNDSDDEFSMGHNEIADDESGRRMRIGFSKVWRHKKYNLLSKSSKVINNRRNQRIHQRKMRNTKIIAKENKQFRFSDQSNYEADVSSDTHGKRHFGNNSIDKYYIPRHTPDLLQTLVEKADIFLCDNNHSINKGSNNTTANIPFNHSNTNNNNFDINPCLVELTTKILLSLPETEVYQQLCLEMLTNVHSVFRTLPWQLQRPFVLDEFLEECYDNIEAILLNDTLPELQMVLLKLLLLPSSDWLTAARLRFAVDITQKNPNIAESILKILLEKCSLCSSLQPDKALIQPTTGHQITSTNKNSTISFSSNQSQPETIINIKLTSQRWASLDPDFFFKTSTPMMSQSNLSGVSSDASTGQLPQQSQTTINKNEGFSISMWMKLDSRIMKSGNKKHNRNDFKKYKKRLNKPYTGGSTHKPSMAPSLQSLQEEAFLHVVSLYSQDKTTKMTVQCLQVWCKPSAGSLMLRLYQQVEKLPVDTTKHNPNPKTVKASSTKNRFNKRRYTITFPWQRSRQSTSSVQTTPDVNEPFVIIDPNLINSFNLVGESVVTNFISTNNWNFISITLDWCCTSEFAEITWLLNSNVKRHTKLFKSPYHTIRHNNVIESFISLGHVIDDKDLAFTNCPRYLLGSLFVFEDPILRTSLDNLSLMLLGLNWDGELNNINPQFDHQQLLDLAIVTLILLVDNEPGVERAAELMRKGQGLLWKPVLTNQNELLGFSVLDGCDDWTWWERIRAMQEHLLAIFLADDKPCILANPTYKGSTSLCLPIQQLSSNLSNPLSNNYTIGVSIKNSLDIAFDNLGGVNFVLFWLAKMIEENQEANTKLMLMIYLCLIRKSGLLCYQNHQDRGYSILFQIFKTFNFDLTPEIIDNLIRHAIYESPVRPSIHMTQLTNPKQLCRDSDIIRDLLLQWKIWSCSKEISKFRQQIMAKDTLIHEDHFLQIDLLLLNQINNLLIESNQYSIINCISLDNGIHSNGYYGHNNSPLMTSILDALLNCCYEPFDYLHSNGLVLPREIFEVLIKIIHNALPTQVDHCMVDKLCLTILQLYPVMMKETSMNIGLSTEHTAQFSRTLRSFSNVKFDNISEFNPFETFYSQLETTHKDTSKVHEISNKPSNLTKGTFAKNDQSLQVSLRESRVSEVEIKLLAQFYRDTLTQAQIEDTLTEEVEEIDENCDNEAMLTGSTSTIDSKDSQNNLEGSMEKSTDKDSLTSTEDEKELPQLDCKNDQIQDNDESSDQHNESSPSNENELSRTETLAGLLSILHNVLQVKLSDTVIQKLSTNDFCFEFCMHLLTHPSCVVRARALSLFHVYLYHRKNILSNHRSRFLTPTNSIASSHSHINSELQLDVIGYLLSQYPCSSKDVVCEVISLVFGQQQMRELITEIDWLTIDLNSVDDHEDSNGHICEDLFCESYPSPTLVTNESNLTNASNSRSSLVYNPIQRLKSVISLVNGKLSPIDEMIHNEMNPLGINYHRNVVLMTSVLDVGNEDIDFLSNQLVWNLKLFGFIFQHNALILHCCMKNGLSECIINLTNQISSQVNTNNQTVESLQTLCAIMSIHIAAAPTSQASSNINERIGNIGFSNLLDTVDLLAMMMRQKNNNIQTTIKSRSWANEVIGKMISTIIWNIIDTICWLNAKDPALRLDHSDELKQGHNLIQKTINYSLIGKVDRDITNKLIKTLNLAFTISLNTKNNFQKSEIGIMFVKRLVNFTWELICKCLSCQEIPDKFSLFLSTKEYISKYTGDLIVCMTQPSILSDPTNRIQVLESLLRFPNNTRAIRYSLLGNSSGTLCLIVNLKNLYDYLTNLKSNLENTSNKTTMLYSLSQLNYLIEGCTTLFQAVSLEFGSDNCAAIDDCNDQINGDAGNLWQQDMKDKYEVWELISVGILDYWQKTSTGDLKEILNCLSQYQTFYRTVARKNIQKFHNQSCRIRKANEFYRRRQWKKIIENFTQPKAVWHNLSDNVPLIYQLDAAEGPSRIRKRFVRTTHRIPSRFFYDKTQDQTNSSPLQYLFDMTYHEDRIVFEKPIEYQLLKCIEDIRINCACLWVSQSGNFVGEFFLSKTRIGFMVDTQDENKSSYCYDQLPSTMQDFGFISWPLNQIDLLLKRRFKLRDLAFEIFLKDGRNCLIALNTVQERDNIFSAIESYLPSSAKYTSKPARLVDLQHQWVSGELTNFDYLTLLNTAAGRSHNDTMQYPVFPFILTNYSTPTLNLTDEQTFRNLSCPISAQTDKQKERVAQSFRDKAEEYTRQLEMIREMPEDDGASIWAMPPHHYSSLYSNAATILYYLVRVPPFTQKSIEFQDNEFDRPDRLFHTLESAWTLSTTSFSCVKELIPEFFYLPEMFLNNRQFDFGLRLSGDAVDNVTLPKWANDDARLFCLIHRAALESPHVTVQLSHWIDLIFGYKQTGKPAMDALNLFHPYTYFKAICPDEITDSIRRRAVEQMIENYGQIPKQLFVLRSHPPRKVAIKKQLSSSIPAADKQPVDMAGIEQGCDLLTKTDERPRKSSASKSRDRSGMSVLSNITGVNWGDYVGSPDNNETYLDEVMRKQDGSYGGLFQLPSNTQATKNIGSRNSISGVGSNSGNLSNNRLIVIPPLCGLLVLSNTDDNTIPVIKFKISHTGRRIQVTYLILSSQGTVTSLHRSNSFLSNSIPNAMANSTPILNNISASNSSNFNNQFANQTGSSTFYNHDYAESKNFSVSIETGGVKTRATAIAVYQRAARVFVGLENGSIQVYQGDSIKYKNVPLFLDCFHKHWITLKSHQYSIKMLIVNESFSLIISTDSQSNVAIWDPQRLQLLQLLDWSSVPSGRDSLNPNEIPRFSTSANNSLPRSSLDINSANTNFSTHSVTNHITAIGASETLGDIVIARLMSRTSLTGQPISHISLFTMNAKYLHYVFLPGKITAISYSQLQEGRNVNAIACSTLQGHLIILSSWNLQIIWRNKIALYNSPTTDIQDSILTMKYSGNGKEIYLLHKNGNIHILKTLKSESTAKNSILYWPT